MKLRIKLICEPLLWRRVSIVPPPTLPPVGEPDFWERSSPRRRPKKKYQSPKTATAPTPPTDPTTIPAIFPPLKDELSSCVDDEALEVADEAEDESETVIVTGWPATVWTETVGAVVVDVSDAEEVYA